MVILESKEQLTKQIEEDWEIIAQADEALDSALQALNEARTKLRNFARSVNGPTEMGGSTRVGAASSVGARPEAQATNLRRMPAIRKEYVLRAGRNTPVQQHVNTDAESGC